MKYCISLRLIILTALIVCFYSCVEYGYETDESVDVTVSVGVEDNLPWEMPQNFPNLGNYDRRCVVEAFPRLATGDYAKGSVGRWIFKQAAGEGLKHMDIDLTLQEGEYQVWVWQDYVPHGTTDDLFYSSSDMAGGVRLRSLEEYPGPTDYKDAFAGKIELTAEMGHQNEVMVLQRPLGKYVLVSTDLEAFQTKITKTKGSDFSLKDYSAKITYVGYTPISYNIYTDRVNDSQSNFSYTSPIECYSDGKAVIASDYVMTNPPGEETNVIISVDILDETGTVIASYSQAKVSLTRGGLTVVEGQFLTSKSSGGVSLDTEFSDKIFIPIK